ncbi:Hemolysin, plasmid [Phaeobacter italicus]|jgi:Ca2+-binding RTX toxin-like protein|uniref:Hemolysin, plasmid n=1 Tax=Phaeobacter italicus TaxID=481446 RepID=A0A0H5CX26_9RHOB|nr:calcium-binding protein [Phaeobacter italicus]CRL09481.1 Hemolysin, plasmid [Phaeobacter italicus]
MANVFVATVPGVSSLRNRLSFDGLEKGREAFTTVVSDTELEQVGSDGSILRLFGNFSSEDQAEWIIYAIDHSLDGAPIISMSDLTLSFSDFSTLGSSELSRLMLAGDDRISTLQNSESNLRTFGGNDEVLLGSGNDVVRAGGGHDQVRGELGDDRLIGGYGRDTLHGNGGEDILRGGVGRDLLFAGVGNDDVGGGAGADRLFGGHGSDVLRGGAGADRINGGTGDDTMYGGAGADVFVFNRGDHTDRIVDFEVGVDRIRLNRGAESMDDVDFGLVGDDVAIYFANVTVFVENTTIAELDNADNFLF